MLIHHWQLLDLVAVQAIAGLLQRRADWNSNQALAGHQIRDRAIRIGLKTNIAVGENGN